MWHLWRMQARRPIATRRRFGASVCLSCSPQDHPLCGRKVVEWQALRNEHFIIRESNCSPALCERVIKHLSDRTRTPSVQKAEVGCETVMHLVAMGRGVTLTSEATIATSFPEVVFRPISGGDAILQFSAIWWPGNDNPALRRFLSLARALAKAKRHHPNGTTPRNSTGAVSARGISVAFLAALARGLGLSS